MTLSHGQLIVALDVDTFEEAARLVEALGSTVEIFKVGSQLFVACGPEIVRYLQSQGKKVFLDLKFHDIPNTVAQSTSRAIAMGVNFSKPRGRGIPGLFMLTIHTQGGEAMLKAAVQASRETAKQFNVKPPLVVGVTVLTSEAKGDNITTLVLERSLLAKHSGLEGVVASPQEAGLIRRELGQDFIIVTPGIRPEDIPVDDQQRTVTPREAILKGSDYLVVGRPIIKAPQPLKAAEKILDEIRIASQDVRRKM